MKIKNIIFCGLILCPYFIFTQRPQVSPSIILNICDRKYIYEMQIILDSLRGRISDGNLKLIEEYMLMIKQHNDLEIKIAQYEELYFDVATNAELRRPFQLYNKCRTAVTSGIYSPPL